MSLLACIPLFSILALVPTAPAHPLISSFALLPNELIYEIACNAWRSHSPDTPCATRLSDLTSLSCVSRRLREISLPILFGDIAVSSPTRLYQLSTANPAFLAFIRALTIYLDKHFFDVWATTLKATHLHTLPPTTEPDPLNSLLKILSQTSTTLHYLAIRLTSSTAESLYFNHHTILPTFPLSHTPLNLTPNLSKHLASLNATSTLPLSLPALRTLHIEATLALTPLLELTPNL